MRHRSTQTLFAAALAVSMQLTGTANALTPETQVTSTAATTVDAAATTGSITSTGSQSPAATTPAPAAGGTGATETASTSPVAVETPPALRVAIPGGAYGAALAQAVLQPFAQTAGIAVDTVARTVATAAAEPAAAWDIAELSFADADSACHAGTLTKVDVTRVAPAPDGAPLDEDFMPGALGDCGVASSAWSSVVVVDTTSPAGRAVNSIADVFDPRIKAVRAFPKVGPFVLEMALLADGVAPTLVYPTLATPEGLERALAKFDAIKRQIVWWKEPSEAFALLKDKKAAVAIAYSGRAFQEIEIGLSPLKVVWDGQVYDLNVWVVNKASPQVASAEAFVSFATRAEQMARQSQLFPYGPSRRSAIALVGQHQPLGVELRAYLPTAPENLALSLQYSELWWRSYRDVIGPRIEEWWTKATAVVVPAQPPATATRKKRKAKSSG